MTIKRVGAVFVGIVVIVSAIIGILYVVERPRPAAVTVGDCPTAAQDLYESWVSANSTWVTYCNATTIETENGSVSAAMVGAGPFHACPFKCRPTGYLRIVFPDGSSHIRHGEAGPDLAAEFRTWVSRARSEIRQEQELRRRCAVEERRHCFDANVTAADYIVEMDGSQFSCMEEGLINETCRRVLEK